MASAESMLVRWNFLVSMSVSRSGEWGQAVFYGTVAAVH